MIRDVHLANQKAQTTCMIPELACQNIRCGTKNRSKECRDDNEKDEFVEGKKQEKGSNTPEVKRATIVGNPMYNRGDGEAAVDEALALDDLHMDYDQIMHYFHNLKESNA